MGCVNESISCCCKKCNTCHDCYQQDEFRIKDLLYAVDMKLAAYYEAKVCKTNWGYSCSNLDNDELDLLILYKDTLSRHYYNIIKQIKPCLCPEELQVIIDGVLELIDISCCKDSRRCDIVVDDSDLESWVLNNKYCVAYEYWESSIYRACNVFSAIVTVVDDPMELLYTLKVIQIAREKDCIDATIGSDYLDKITVEKILKCDFPAIDEHTLAKIAENHQRLIEKIDCNFSFEVYAQLMACNLTNEVIIKLINCGVDVTYNVEKQVCELVHDNKVYPLADMNINVDLSNCSPGFNLLDISDSYENLD